jgi:hypothetical protein
MIMVGAEARVSQLIKTCVKDVLAAVWAPPKKRGMGALSPKERSRVARKAAATRKRNAAGRKAAAIKRARA